MNPDGRNLKKQNPGHRKETDVTLYSGLLELRKERISDSSAYSPDFCIPGTHLWGRLTSQFCLVLNFSFCRNPFL